MSVSAEIHAAGLRSPRWLVLAALVVWLLGACTAAPTATPTLTPEPGPPDPITYDCSLIERLKPASADAQQIVEQMLANFKVDYPKETLELVQLWGVERMGEYALIRGKVTLEQSDLFAVQRTDRGYVMLAHYIVDAPGAKHEVIPGYFVARVPDAPPELFYCIDPRPYVGADQ